MLTYINIKNFAIIKDLEVDLHSEMTGITGETGAGKSIIIDSLELALGARADTSLIRSNAPRSEITVIFDVTRVTKAREWLIEQELDSDNECIIRRIISNDGRSKSSINGIPCAQQTLRALSNFLLSIHGQHEHQNLLNQEYQCELLDAFASNKTLAAKVKELYTDWLKTKKELQELENLTEDSQNKIDFFNHQLKELETINLSSENLSNLRNEQKRLNNMEEFLTNSNLALDLLAKNDEITVINNLFQVKSKLEICQNIDPKFESIIELINNAMIQIEEATNSLQQNINSDESNPKRQHEVEEQLSYIYSLARKHNTQPEELSQIQLSLKKQLDNIQNSSVLLEKMSGELKTAEKYYLETADELSAKRKLAANTLNKLVTEKMNILGMPEGKFKIKILPNPNQNLNAHGLEKIEFLVSLNPGHPLQPLSKIASGGELSRISLAIQAITAEKEVTPTLIFDEIDTGIGGKTADIIGQLLRKLAQKTQVICITHLPQIAAQSHHHLLVEKSISAKKTEVNLNILNKNEKIIEIARMLGGTKITKQTIAHATEILNSVI